MSHNLIGNVIPGVIGLLIILGLIAWCIGADVRAQNGRPPHRVRLYRPAKRRPVSLNRAPEASSAHEREAAAAR